MENTTTSFTDSIEKLVEDVQLQAFASLVQKCKQDVAGFWQKSYGDKKGFFPLEKRNDYQREISTKEKVIFFDTNYNNKLNNNGFLHIDIAPTLDIRYADLDHTVFKIHTKDTSFTGGYFLLKDIVRFKLASICDWITWASHGVDAGDFIDRFFITHANNKMIIQQGFEIEMALYFYSSIK